MTCYKSFFFFIFQLVCWCTTPIIRSVRSPVFYFRFLKVLALVTFLFALYRSFENPRSSLTFHYTLYLCSSSERLTEHEHPIVFQRLPIIASTNVRVFFDGSKYSFIFIILSVRLYYRISNAFSFLFSVPLHVFRSLMT